MKPKSLTLANMVLAFGVFAVGWVMLGRVPPLVMGTHAEFAPFSLRESGEDAPVAGFDVELGWAIAETAGRELKIVELPFEELIPALEAGTVDMLLASMTITPERAKRVAFSDPYYRATQVVLLKAGGAVPDAKAELKGRRIGVQSGTTSEAVARELTEAENIRAVPTGMAAVADLLNGEADVVLMDEQPAVHVLKKNPDLRLIYLDFDDEYYGVAVRKGSVKLLEAVNQTLAEIAEDGRYDWFLDRWMLQAD